MKSLTRSRFTRSLLFAPAALVFHIAVAANAGAPDDLLQQQRQILAGRPAAFSAPPAITYSRESGSKPDAQELARRLLLGAIPAVHDASRPEATHVTLRHSYADLQALAQHVLAGKRYGPSGS
jgi:hypothetical protein